MTLQEKAHSELRNAILTLEVRPGESLSEKEWADRLGMSRTPVRDALRQLEYEGLVVIENQRGWSALSLSLDDIRHIFDIKISLESMIARRAAERISDDQSVQLKQVLEGMVCATEAHDIDAWDVADQSFHRLIYEASGNKRVQQIINGLNDQFHRVRAGHLALQGRMDISLTEHTIIAEAIFAGDGETAEKIVRAHLQNLLRSILNVLESMVLPLAGPRI